MLIDVKLVHCQNTSEPIDVTEMGMVIDVKLEQFWNAYEPIDVILIPPKVNGRTNAPE